MKKLICYLFSIIAGILIIPNTNNIFNSTKCNANYQPIMSIVIDDFGSYDQSGVETMLKINEPLTCAVIPNVDNTKSNLESLSKTNHEIILHMPMQAHVSLPESWYGPTYITTYDNQEIVNEKIDNCIKAFPKIKGFNMHIGSGVGRNKETMEYIYNYAKNNDLYFLDSRTIETNATEQAAYETDSIYLGRDEFLEADKNKSYSNVKFRLLEGARKAIANGSSIVIGHVGAEGGEQTASAIKDTLKEIEQMGVKIVPLSKIYEQDKLIFGK